MTPTWTLVGLVAGWALLGIVPIVWPPTLAAWCAVGTAIGVLATIDAVRVRREAPPIGKRVVSTAMALNNASEVGLSLGGIAPGIRRIEVFDSVPDSMRIEGLPARVDRPAGMRATLTYRVIPTVRGEHSFGRIELRLRSSWALWDRRWEAGEPAHVTVYPNFERVRRYAVIAATQRLHEIGLRVARQRGTGTEFHQLREYRDGDVQRQIDWNATSRRRRLISRDYQQERAQHVVFLLDAGRAMRSVDRGLSHFDHALDAMLLTSHVALRNGDAVGVLTFGGEERWLAPAKGAAALPRLVRSVYDVQSTAEQPDYSAAASRLLALQRRRALVVVVSNLRDEDGHDIATALRLLRRRHLVILASLRQVELDDCLESPVHSESDALRIAGVHRYRAARRAAHSVMAERGVAVLDIAPSALPLALVGRYIEVKQGNVL